MRFPTRDTGQCVESRDNQVTTPTEPEQWQLHPPSEEVPIARWPKLPNFVYADADMLAVPAAANFDLGEGRASLALDRPKRGSAPPKEALWPKLGVGAEPLADVEDKSLLIVDDDKPFLTRLARDFCA